MWLTCLYSLLPIYLNSFNPLKIILVNIKARIKSAQIPSQLYNLTEQL